jgi:hypothetical protein
MDIQEAIEYFDGERQLAQGFLDHAKNFDWPNVKADAEKNINALSFAIDLMQKYADGLLEEKTRCVTNADQIRTMSDEELAEDRVHYRYGGYCTADEGEYYEGDFKGLATSYEEALLRERDWLKQEKQAEAALKEANQ